MPITKTLSDRFEKYVAKTPADVTGARFAAAKPVALTRFIEGSSVIAAIVDATKKILAAEGVPAGAYGVYISFAEKAAKAAFSHEGATLKNFVAGIKAEFAAKGADPAVLDKIAVLITGSAT